VLPSAIPSDLEVLTQDEEGTALSFERFSAADVAGGPTFATLVPDSKGLYHFDVALTSTVQRAKSGKVEPSLVPRATQSRTPTWTAA